MEFNMTLTNIPLSKDQISFQRKTVLVQMLIDVNVVRALWFIQIPLA